MAEEYIDRLIREYEEREMLEGAIEGINRDSVEYMSEYEL